MRWIIPSKAQTRRQAAFSKVKPAHTTPICQDFNLSLESEAGVDVAPEDEVRPAPSQLDHQLQAEFDAWEAASDEALENFERGLPE